MSDAVDPVAEGAQTTAAVDGAIEGSLLERAVNRTLAPRYAAAVEDVDKIVEATYEVIERTGEVNPKMRDILAQAELSTQQFYRHFRSKDELILALLDDGRRRLAGYLTHQMVKCPSGLDQVREWVAGTLAQAKEPKAAARTRPFVVSHGHLREQYPDEHEASIGLLVGLLSDALVLAVAQGHVQSDDPERDARAIYLMTQGLMDRHLISRTTPTDEDVRHAVGFVLRALGVDGDPTDAP